MGVSALTRRFVAPGRSEFIGIVVIGTLLLGGGVAAGLSLARDVFSATAFVTQYLRAVENRDVVTAISMPGVLPIGVDRDEFLTRPENVLLTSAAMKPGDDLRVIREEDRNGVRHVFALDSANPSQTMEFAVVQTGRNAGMFPQWRFVSSPLGTLDVETIHATFFSVNGFGPIDLASVTPTVSPNDFSAHGSFSVFAPGLYLVETSSSALSSKPVSLSLAQPGSIVHATVTAEPTTAFLTRVQREVDQFFDDCVSQRVLFPAGCPFGISVENRISGAPQWGILNRPQVSLRPTASGWEIVPGVWTLTFDADIQSLFDGSISPAHEEIPLTIGGRVLLTASGDISVTIDRID